MTVDTIKPPEQPKGFKKLDDIWKDVQKLNPDAQIDTLYWLAERDGTIYPFKDASDEPEHHVLFRFGKSGTNFAAAKYTEHDGVLIPDSYLEYSFPELGRLVDRSRAGGFVPLEKREVPAEPAPEDKQTTPEEPANEDVPPWEGSDHFPERTPLQPVAPASAEKPDEVENNSNGLKHVYAASTDLLRTLTEQGKHSAARVWGQIRVLRRSPDFRLHWQNTFDEYNIPERLADLAPGASETETELGVRLFQQKQMRIGYKPKDVDDATAHAVPTLIIRLVRKWREFEKDQETWNFSAPQVRAFAAFVVALEDMWENESPFLRELQKKGIRQVVIDSGGLRSLPGEKLKELLVIPAAFGVVPEEKE